MTFCFRFLHIFSVHKQLGPKLVMIGSMVRVNSSISAFCIGCGSRISISRILFWYNVYTNVYSFV